MDEQTFGKRLLQNIMAMGPLSVLSLPRNLRAVRLATLIFPRQALTDRRLLLFSGAFAADLVAQLPPLHYLRQGTRPRTATTRTNPPAPLDPTFLNVELQEDPLEMHGDLLTPLRHPTMLGLANAQKREKLNPPQPAVCEHTSDLHGRQLSEPMGVFYSRPTAGA